MVLDIETQLNKEVDLVCDSNIALLEQQEAILTSLAVSIDDSLTEAITAQAQPSNLSGTLIVV